VNLIRPPHLNPGDRVRVVATSGPVDRERFEAGLQVLEKRYSPVYEDPALYARRGFLAGEDADRLRALHDAIEDEESRAIFLARGGYGLLRLLGSIDQDLLRAHPKPIIGFSDATALLALCAGAGVAAIHGPVVSQLGVLPATDLEALFALLEVPEPHQVLAGLAELVPGRTRGFLLGGNLEVLTRLLGTQFQPDFSGAVLFLEEVGEVPYRLDRLLTHLELAGVLLAVAGIVIGDLIDCDYVEDGTLQSPTATDVVAERLSGLGIPVALGGSFGHGERNSPLPYGAQVELDTGAGTLTALESPVS
jgi:muramoyltetrapeptide carboxypeptidase